MLKVMLVHKLDCIGDANKPPFSLVKVGVGWQSFIAK
jgi:hypothetical protein